MMTKWGQSATGSFLPTPEPPHLREVNAVQYNGWRCREAMKRINGEQDLGPTGMRLALTPDQGEMDSIAPFQDVIMLSEGGSVGLCRTIITQECFMSGSNSPGILQQCTSRQSPSIVRPYRIPAMVGWAGKEQPFGCIPQQALPSGYSFDRRCGQPTAITQKEQTMRLRSETKEQGKTALHPVLPAP